MRLFEAKSRKYMIEVNIMKKAVAMMMTAAMGMAVLADAAAPAVLLRLLPQQAKRLPQ